MFNFKKWICAVLNKALRPFNQFDACVDCGKRTDGLMTCYFVDGETTKLCPDCLTGSGFCYRCGNYSSGQESFDIFTDMPGYCSECREEIKSEFGDYDDEEDYDGNFYNNYSEDNFESDDDDSNDTNDSRNL